jgi:hypothetical protein
MPDRALPLSGRSIRVPGLWVMTGDRIGFVRVLGFGIAWKDSRRHRPLWSERERIFRQIHIGHWVMTPLPRGDRGFRR